MVNSEPASLPPDPNSIEDRALIEATLTGSQAAFEALIARHQEKIFRLLQRFTRDAAEVEDLAQEVFLKAYRRLHTFQFGSAFYTWLYRVAVNTANDAVQRRKRSPVRAVEDPGVFESADAQDGPAAPDRSMLEGELVQATRVVLDRMPEKFRNILVLREFEDLSYEEIAASLGCALGTVESRLFRARARFRELLEELYPEFAQGK